MDATILNMMAFYILAGMSVGSALMILFSNNIVRCVFLLIVVFLGIAAIFMMTNAEFVGVTQILVYVGGILILLMFGIMLTTRLDGNILQNKNARILTGGLVGITTFLVFQRYIRESGHLFSSSSAKVENVTKTIGIELMSRNILSLELVAILLLVALVGAAFIAGTKFQKSINSKS